MSAIRHYISRCATVPLLIFAIDVAALQLSGVVMTEAGSGLDGALVEAWSPPHLLAARLTNSNGEFSFGLESVQDATVLTIRRIGYRSARIDLDHARNGITVRLQPLPVHLDPVSVTGVDACPIRDEAEARALWQAMRNRHLPLDPAPGIWSAVRITTTWEPINGAGAVDSANTVGLVMAGGDYLGHAIQQIMAQGYAIPYSGLRGGRFDAWRYPHLESFLAGHFVDSVFGALHTFAIRHEEGRGTSLQFCPRRPRSNSIEGNLLLGPDSSLAAVSWLFRTREPTERAGGEVVFVRALLSGRQLALHPVMGMYWRRRVVDIYREKLEFAAWESCAASPAASLCRQ